MYCARSSGHDLLQLPVLSNIYHIIWPLNKLNTVYWTRPSVTRSVFLPPYPTSYLLFFGSLHAYNLQLTIINVSTSIWANISVSLKKYSKIKHLHIIEPAVPFTCFLLCLTKVNIQINRADMKNNLEITWNGLKMIIPMTIRGNLVLYDLTHPSEKAFMSLLDHHCSSLKQLLINSPTSLL